MSTSPWIVRAAVVLAALVAAASLGGIFVPAIYARETPLWAAQAVGQDWVNLVIVAPVLLGCAFALRRASRSALLVFGGAAGYVAYSFAIYAFAVHFNALFLVYCGALGTAFYALLGVARHANAARTWLAGPLPLRRIGAWLLIVTGAAFGVLWLASVIPALVRGEAPAGLAEVGLATNPVYVLDLSTALPGLLAAGVLVLRGRSIGWFTGSILLGFTAFMAAAMIGMFVVMRSRGLAAGLGAAGPMAILCASSGTILCVWLGALRSAAAAPASARDASPARP